MVVILLEKAKPALRGELSRWLSELRTGVYLGKVSAIVRDALWRKCVENIGPGGAMLIHTAPTEQGFLVRTTGTLSRELVDLEGLYLARKPTRT